MFSMARARLKFLINFLLFSSAYGSLTDCPSSDWKRIKGKCFLFLDESLDYSAAAQRCSDENGKLFEPQNDPSNNLIFKIANQELTTETEYWIGINDQVSEGKFVFNSSGLEIYYENWARSPTDEPSSIGDCVYVGSTNQWAVTMCTQTKSVICEDFQEDVSRWNSCPPGWDLINKKCYLLVDQTMKFETGKDLCKAFGAKVFEPSYEKEEEMVHSFYNGEQIWLGVQTNSNGRS